MGFLTPARAVKRLLAVVIFGHIIQASAFFTMKTYAPSHPEVHDKVINARNYAFIVGAASPNTQCNMPDASKCPAGKNTLINDQMTSLASAVPGGQFIFVGPDGSVSYSKPHSNMRPPGSQMGGFRPQQIKSDCSAAFTVLTWQSMDGYSGLWACPTAARVPLAQEAVLKASRAGLKQKGCVPVEGVQIQPAGDAFGAWAYA